MCFASARDPPGCNIMRSECGWKRDAPDTTTVEAGYGFVNVNQKDREMSTRKTGYARVGAGEGEGEGEQGRSKPYPLSPNSKFLFIVGASPHPLLGTNNAQLT